MKKTLFISSILLLLGGLLLTEPNNYINSLAEEEYSHSSYELENFTNIDNYKLAEKSSIENKDDKSISIIGGATYKLPFYFKENEEHKIKFKFNIDQMSSGEYSYVIFHANPENTFNDVSDEIPGLYCRISMLGSQKYTFETFYTDGVNYKVEPIAGANIYEESPIKDHTIQLETSLIQGYTSGIRLFYQGVHFGDWLGYSLVKNRNITDETSNIYVSVIGNISITNILPNDLDAPKITITESEKNSHFANEEFVIENIEVYDAIDLNVPYTYKILNPSNKDITYKSYLTEEGKIAFVPVEAGDYLVRVSASDYSYNTASKRLNVTISNRPHFPVFVGEPAFIIAARKSEKYYFPEGNAIDIQKENPDNNINYAYSGYFFDASNTKRDLDIKKDNKGCYFEPTDYEPYSNTDGTGKYYLTISATNSYGTTYFEKEIWVKYDITGEESFNKNNLFNKNNWSLNKQNKFDDTGAYFAGTTYYKAGLYLDDGIKINFSILDIIGKGDEDKWFSFSLLKHPGNARYGNPNKDCGLYFMFFYRNNNLLINIQYIYSDGTYRDVVNSTVLYSEIPDQITLEITPFDVTLDASMDDNISIFFDGNEVDSFEIYKIYRSDWADDEGFVYLACGYNNLKDNHATNYEDSNNPKYRINSITKTDKTAPVISLLGEFISSCNGQQTITLPEAKGIDETDGEITAQLLRVKNAEGKSITVINNQFTPTSNGTYTVIYSSTDSSGNTALLEKTIEVSGIKNGCGGSIEFSSTLIVLLSIFGLALILKRRKLTND